jgi:hypothetical protein
LVRNNGIFYGGYTPWRGQTKLTEHFMNATDPAIRYVQATWDDAPHMDEEAKRVVMKSYPEHERASRSTGIPMMGEGAIFSTPESSFVIDPIRIPDHWARIKGVDFGLAHPAAVVNLAFDRDTGIVYVYRAWRDFIKRTADHIEAINADGEDWVPVAWPHDGEKRDPKSGTQLVAGYRKRCAMLAKSARYKNDVGGGQSVWKSVEDVRERLANGTWKVFRTCKPWLEEYRTYHTQDGVIVARRDDCLKASFYAHMMLRFAKTKAHVRSERIEMQMAPFTTR